MNLSLLASELSAVGRILVCANAVLNAIQENSRCTCFQAKTQQTSSNILGKQQPQSGNRKSLLQIHPYWLS